MCRRLWTTLFQDVCGSWQVPVTAAAARGRLARWLATGEFPAVAPSDADAGVLAGAAVEQGLASLVHDAITEQRLLWPRAAELTLRRAAEDDFTRGVRQLDTAGRIQDLFAAGGIRCLPLKGVALAERLYGSVAHRPMVDVDLLVLDNWSEAVRLLTNGGFRPDRRADHAAAFVHSHLGVVVELHRHITSCARLFSLDVDGVWNRSVSGHGLVKRVPSAEDLLVQLALHAAFQHGLALRLVQFLDFRRLLERQPPDPVVLDRIIVDGPARRAVALALEAARVFVSAPIDRVLGDLIDTWLPRPLRRYLDRFIVLSPTEPPLAWIRWQLTAGHRAMLIRETVGHGSSVFSTSGLFGAVRALRLAARWARPTLRSLRAAP
jgi:Uncharacterised nucleotidyltransferase